MESGYSVIVEEEAPTSSIYLAPNDDSKIVFQLNDFLPAIHNVSSYTTGKSGTGFFPIPLCI